MVTSPCSVFLLGRCITPIYCSFADLFVLLFFFLLQSKNVFADHQKACRNQLFLEDLLCTISLLKNFSEKRLVPLLYNLCLIDCPRALSHFVYEHLYINGFYGRGNNVDSLLTDTIVCFTFLEKCDEKVFAAQTMTLKTKSKTIWDPLFSGSDRTIVFGFQISAPNKQSNKRPLWNECFVTWRSLTSCSRDLHIFAKNYGMFKNISYEAISPIILPIEGSGR